MNLHFKVNQHFVKDLIVFKLKMITIYLKQEAYSMISSTLLPDFTQYKHAFHSAASKDSIQQFPL